MKDCWEEANKRKELRQAKALRKIQSAKNKKKAAKIRLKLLRRATASNSIKRDLLKSYEQNEQKIEVSIEETDLWNTPID